MGFNRRLQSLIEGLTQTHLKTEWYAQQDSNL